MKRVDVRCPESRMRSRGTLAQVARRLLEPAERLLLVAEILRPATPSRVRASK
jgi:hypothetical protein